MKPTLILGASNKPERYSNRAQKKLIAHSHPLTLVSRQTEVIDGIKSHTDISQIQSKIHTVTVYINPSLMMTELNKIIQLKPERVIFNPGTESIEAMQKLKESGIEIVEDCTLIMLNNNDY